MFRFLQLLLFYGIKCKNYVILSFNVHYLHYDLLHLKKSTNLKF